MNMQQWANPLLGGGRPTAATTMADNIKSCHDIKNVWYN